MHLAGASFLSLIRPMYQDYTELTGCRVYTAHDKQVQTERFGRYDQTLSHSTYGSFG